MDIIELILIFIVVSILCGKWILFILLSPLIVYKMKVSKRNASASDLKIEDIPSPEGKKTTLKSYIKELLNGFIRYIIIQTGYIPSHCIRNIIYKYFFLVHLGKNAIIYYGAEIRGSYRLRIGEGSIIGDKAVLDARRGGIIIGDNVQFGSFVRLWTGSHDLNDPYFRSTPSKRGRIIIGNRVWIGPSVTILHSVSIGDGSVIAAGSVVTKDIPPYEIWAGIPAKKIGQRSRDLKYIFKKNPIPFY